MDPPGLSRMTRKELIGLVRSIQKRKHTYYVYEKEETDTPIILSQLLLRRLHRLSKP